MASNRLNTGTIWIEDAVTSANRSSLPYPGQLGMFFEKDGKKFQLVQVHSSSNNTAANDVMVWSDYDDFVVTNDVSDVSATAAVVANRPAGIAAGTITAGNYGFIQVRGPVTIRTNQDDDIAAGDSIIADGDEDGQCDSVAAGTASTAVTLAIATAAYDDASDTVAALLIVPLNGA